MHAIVDHGGVVCDSVVLVGLHVVFEVLERIWGKEKTRRRLEIFRHGDPSGVYLLLPSPAFVPYLTERHPALCLCDLRGTEVAVLLPR